jgi:hypothetical protein
VPALDKAPDHEDRLQQFILYTFLRDVSITAIDWIQVV